MTNSKTNTLDDPRFLDADGCTTGYGMNNAVNYLSISGKAAKGGVWVASREQQRRGEFIRLDNDTVHRLVARLIDLVPSAAPCEPYGASEQSSGNPFYHAPAFQLGIAEGIRRAKATTPHDPALAAAYLAGFAKGMRDLLTATNTVKG